MSSTPLDLRPGDTTPPIIRLTSQIIKDAIKLKADGILLELDLELHLKAHTELQALKESWQQKPPDKDQILFQVGKLPSAVELIYEIGGKREQMRRFSGELFGNVVNVLLLATGLPPWTKGEISAPLETIKPNSKWILESNDVTRRIQLRRIRAN